METTMLSTTTQNQIDHEWQPKHPTYEASDVRNDAFRNAFDKLAKVAIPFFDHKYMYYSDLLWDAGAMARLDVDDVMFIILRDVGTNVVHPISFCDEAVQRSLGRCTQRVDMNSGYRAVLKVYRHQYDSFDVTVVYERTDRRPSNL